MRSFRTYSAAVLLGLLLWSGHAAAQCAGGLIVNCPSAVSPEQGDYLQLWQNNQNPHMRRVPLSSVGGTGGPAFTQQITQSVTNAQYGSGAAVGGLMTFNVSAHSANYSGNVQSMTIGLPDLQYPTLNVIIFSSQPTTSTITDRQPVSISTADQAKEVGILFISACTQNSTTTSCQSGQNPLSFNLLGKAAPTTLYAVIVAQNIFTPSNLPAGAPAWTITLATQQN